MITSKIIPFVPKLVNYAQYADKKYWIDRYENLQNSCEWYEDYETIKPIINELNLSKRSANSLLYGNFILKLKKCMTKVSKSATT